MFSPSGLPRARSLYRLDGMLRAAPRGAAAPGLGTRLCSSLPTSCCPLPPLLLVVVLLLRDGLLPRVPGFEELLRVYKAPAFIRMHTQCNFPEGTRDRRIRRVTVHGHVKPVRCGQCAQHDHKGALRALHGG